MDPMQSILQLVAQVAFNPEGDDYDYESAIAAGMGPNGTGANVGHWGSVRETTRDEMLKYGLPAGSYLMLKGRNHPTWKLGVEGEAKFGRKIKKFGDRYFAVPGQ